MKLIASSGFLVAASAFHIAAPPPTFRFAARCAAPVVQEPDFDIDAAADAVKKVAAEFGDQQAKLAAAWVDAAIGSDGCPTSSLLEEQLVLFEECLVDDKDGKCKELDAALTAFETTLGPGFKLPWAKERAAAKVSAAAAKFGVVQQQVAKDWAKKAIVLGETSDGPSLMEQQVLIFGECAVTEDGNPDPKCVALFEALDDLQVALTGKVVAPSAAAAAPAAPAAPLTGQGFEGGQGGQFKQTESVNNGCWPYA